MICLLLSAIVLLGSPGAGKGTFAQEYKAKHPEVEHFSIGDWIRKEVKEKTPLGLEILEEMKKESFILNGYLLDEAFVQKIVAEKINEYTKQKKTFILDGFPRTLAQAQFLTRNLTEKTDYIYLTIDRNIAKERMLQRISCSACGRIYNMATLPPKVEGECDYCLMPLVKRDTDQEKVIDERMKGFEEITQKVIQFYMKEGKLFILDGSLPPNEIISLFENL